MPLPQHYARRSCYAAYLMLILSTFWKKMLPGIQPYNLHSYPTETTILRKLFCALFHNDSLNKSENFCPSLQICTVNAFLSRFSSGFPG